MGNMLLRLRFVSLPFCGCPVPVHYNSWDCIQNAVVIGGGAVVSGHGETMKGPVQTWH